MEKWNLDESFSQMRVSFGGSISIYANDNTLESKYDLQYNICYIFG